jgi:hypothetical protein
MLHCLELLLVRSAILCYYQTSKRTDMQKVQPAIHTHAMEDEEEDDK